MLRAAQAAVLLDRLERARAAVGRGRAADAEQHDLRAGVDGGADQLAGAVRRRRPGVALVLGHEPEAGGGGHLEHGRAAVLDQPELRARAGARAGRCTSAAIGLAAEREQQRLHRALAAVGQRAQVGRHQPGALEPAADRAGDLGGAERALERVGRDEHGTLRHGCHRRILTARARARRSVRARND